MIKRQSDVGYLLKCSGQYYFDITKQIIGNTGHSYAIIAHAAESTIGLFSSNLVYIRSLLLQKLLMKIILAVMPRLTR